MNSQNVIIVGYKDRSNNLYQFSPKVQVVNIVEKVERIM
jgi:hypothetical protein